MTTEVRIENRSSQKSIYVITRDGATTDPANADSFTASSFAEVEPQKSLTVYVHSTRDVVVSERARE